jgi:hypothetical protein
MSLFRLGLDNSSSGAILGLSQVGTTNRQTDREVGAQSEGPRTAEVAWLPKPRPMNRFDGFRPVLTHHLRDRGVRWLVGPGLFLALALCAGPSRAEVPVGLDAQGVSAQAVLDDRYGLDARDELGRPVTREKILADMKRASAERAAKTAYASRLPKAAVLMAALELLAKAVTAWSGALPLRMIAEVAAAPVPKPKLVLWLVALALASLAACCRGLRDQHLSLFAVTRQSRPLVLRC